MSGYDVDAKFRFDPMDTSKSKDWDFIERIRQERGVCRPAEHVVLTAKYDETKGVFLDRNAFSSAGDMRAPGVVVPNEECFLGELDAPLHPRIRRLLARGFTRKAAEAAEPWTRANIVKRLEGVIEDRGGDLMARLAIPLPGSVAAHALGIPDELHEQVMNWCNELLHSDWPAYGKTDRGQGIAGAFPELAATLDELIAERRDRVGARDSETPDMLSIMVQSRDEDGWKIPEQHVRTLCVNVLAGSLSASYMIGNLLYRYLTDEESFAAVLRANAECIPDAVEESLRLEASVAYLYRTATESNAVGKCPIREGEQVMLGITSANCDEDMFDAPREFRLDRHNKSKHLAFGVGSHLCLGNHLTRMVGRVVLEEVLDHFGPGKLQLVPDYAWVCVEHPLEYGPETLDVVVATTERSLE